MKTGKNARVMLLSQKLMLGSVILVFLAIGFTIVMVLRLNLKLQSHRTETTLHDLGEMVAANPLVIQAFKEDQSSEELILYLDNLIKGRDHVGGHASPAFVPREPFPHRREFRRW